MSKSPASAQKQLSLLQEQGDQMQRGGAGPGPSQYSTPNHAHGQALNIEREDPHLPQQHRVAQEKLALAQAAARMAVDAANLAGQAADMARQAADMAARAADQPWDGLYQPPAHQAFDQFPRQRSSSFAPLPPQPPRQIDQPMENYLSQFPAASASKRKRKSRASAQDANSSSSGPPAATAPNPIVRREHMSQEALNDYQMQLMLLEQQKKRTMKPQTRQRRSGAGSGSAGAPAVNYNAPAVNFDANEVPRPMGLTDYQYQLTLLKQHNRKIQEEQERLQQERGEGEGHEGS